MSDVGGMSAEAGGDGIFHPLNKGMSRCNTIISLIHFDAHLAHLVTSSLLDLRILLTTLVPRSSPIHVHIVDSQYIFDYALIFKTPDPAYPLMRIDLTIIPKVYRRDSPVSAFLCRPDPGRSNGPVELAANIYDYVPQKGSCNASGRAFPYSIASSDYATTHPEERTWLQGRLDKTAQAVQQFVADAGFSLNISESRLKIAIAHSGGGKRAMLHSFGTCIKALSGKIWSRSQYFTDVSNLTESINTRCGSGTHRPGGV